MTFGYDSDLTDPGTVAGLDNWAESLIHCLSEVRASKEVTNELRESLREPFDLFYLTHPTGTSTPITPCVPLFGWPGCQKGKARAFSSGKW